MATRGKALKKQKLLNEIPKDLQTRFEPIKKLKGKEFIDKAYSEMVDYMGLKGIAPQNIIKDGTEKEFLAAVKDKWTQDLAKKVREEYKDVLKMPKFEADSLEGKKAYEHLKANSEYEGLNIFGVGSDAYKNNPLEIEAYAFGDNISELFKKFCTAHNIK